MRIAHLPSSYLPDALGGTEVYVSTLVRALGDQGKENCVVVHGEKTSSQPDPAELVRLPALPKVGRAKLYSGTIDTSPPGFQQFVQSWRPDVLHFHANTLGASVDHARVLRKLKVPYVITYHTPAQLCPRGTLMFEGREPCDGSLSVKRCSHCVFQAKGVPVWLATITANSPLPPAIVDGPWIPWLSMPSLIRNASSNFLELFENASRIIACAQFCKDVLIENAIPESKICVLRQALPGVSRTRNLRLARDPKHLRIGYFRRITPVKGVDLAANAIQQLLQDGFRASLEIVGPFAESEKTWLDKILAEPATQYLGILRGEQLKNWIETLDLILIPSRWLETGPLTLLEAWDCSTAVIGTRAGGIRDFLDDAGHQDCLFDNESVAGLACAIKFFAARTQPLPDVRIPGMTELAGAYSSIYDSVVNKYA